MKLIFGFLSFAVTIAITAGLYLVFRKPAQKKIDLDKLYRLSGKIALRIRQCGDYLFNLFSSNPEASIGQPAGEPTVPAS
jgi:hypothetical protein